MKEQIDSISKHIAKIKEIALANEEQLTYHSSELNEDEKKKILEAQKLAQSITDYNIVEDFNRAKKFNSYVRYGYFWIIGIVIGLLWLISWDYVIMKSQNQETNNIIAEKEEIIEQQEILKAEIITLEQKNQDLTRQLTQKDIQISLLRRNLWWNVQTIPEVPREVQTPSTSTQNSCNTLTTISTPLRDAASTQSNILSTLPSLTPVEVQSFVESDSRRWFFVKFQEQTGWIASIGISNFDVNCLN